MCISLKIRTQKMIETVFFFFFWRIVMAFYAVAEKEAVAMIKSEEVI